MIHSIDKGECAIAQSWMMCAPIFFVFTIAMARTVRDFSRDGTLPRKNEIQTKTISLRLLLYYYCCGKDHSSGKKPCTWSRLSRAAAIILHLLCCLFPFPRCDHYLRIAQILFIANECWMITAPITHQSELFSAMP